MKYIVCSMRDRMAEVYSRPTYWPAVGMAIRSFTDEVNRSAPDNPLWKHPDDYDFFHIATWDEETAPYSTLVQPVQLAMGKLVKVRD